MAAGRCRVALIGATKPARLPGFAKPADFAHHPRTVAGRGGERRVLGRIGKASAACALQLLAWPAAAAALAPGAVAPAFALPSLVAPDQRVTLAEHRGKVLYIDFWSAWCAPCREALPALAALREQYPRDRFEVIGINVDPTPEAARRMLSSLGANYPMASDTAAESATMYGVEALPAAFLVGADGIVRHVQRGPVAKDINGIKARLAALVEPESAQPEVRKAMTSKAFDAPRAAAVLAPRRGTWREGLAPHQNEQRLGAATP